MVAKAEILAGRKAEDMAACHLVESIELDSLEESVVEALVADQELAVVVMMQTSIHRLRSPAAVVFVVVEDIVFVEGSQGSVTFEVDPEIVVEHLA